jgi:PAS domain S-box-containing protein
LAGLGGGAWTYYRAEERALHTLTVNALRCAVAFRGSELQSLTGTRADLENPAYASVKQRLIELRHVQAGVRFVYIFRPKVGTGEVVYLADSEPVDSEDISLPGDDFPEAATSPGLQSIIATGLPSTEGPLRDSFGVWVTAYAPVRSTPALAPDIIGLDIDAHAWRVDLLEQGFRSALYIWLLFGLPLVLQAVLRRWSAQERTIRTLSEAVEQSRSALMMTGLDCRIQYVNRGLCDQLGYSREELIGRNWTDFKTDTTSSDVLKDLVATVHSGRTWEGEWFNRRKTGDLYPVHGVVSPVMGPRGRILCFVAMLRDMTGERRAQDELRGAKDRAEASERAKGGFLDMMSHELRTPLNGIVGFTSLLLDTPLTSEQREYVQTVRSSGEVLLRMTGDILDYSRMESRPPPVELHPCEVRVLVEEVLDLLAHMAAEKKIVLLHQVGLEVPAVAMLDSGRLRQVLINLVGNAVKFTEAGEVEVRVRVRAGDDSGGANPWLEFAVRDTGPGISDEDQKRLFQPFTQLDASINRRHGGTGLGLAISRSLVRLMGGEISLRSELGKGAVFRFSIPGKSERARVVSPVLAGSRVGLVVRPPGLLRELSRVILAAGGVPVACRLDELKAGGNLDLAVVDCDQGVMAQVFESAVDFTAWPPGTVVGLVTSSQGADDRRHLREIFHSVFNKPLHHDALVNALASGVSRLINVDSAHPRFDLRVLIVDDNAVNLRLLQGLVTVLGCRSVAVLSARAAIQALAQDSAFDVVMLDLRMPDMDGLEMLRRVRAGEAGESARGTWITIVTADTQTEARDALFASGCNDFVPKPLTLTSCIAALQRVQTRDGRRSF